MKTLLIYFTSFIGGYAAHQFYHPTRALGDKLGKNVRHAIGIIGIIPFFIAFLVHRWCKPPETPADGVEWALGAFLEASGSFGAGVFAGDIDDTLRGR